MSDEYVYEYSQEEPREENTSTPRPKPTKTKQPTVIFGNPSKINFERIKLINKNTKVQQTNHQNILQSIPKGITIKKSPASASTSTPAVKSITSIPKITITPSLQSSQANKTETVKRIKISTSPNTTPASNSESNLNQHVSLSSLSSPPEQDTSIKPSTSKPSGIPKSTDATSHAESTTNETLSSALAEQDDTSFRSMVIKRFDDVDKSLHLSNSLAVSNKRLLEDIKNYIAKIPSTDFSGDITNVQFPLINDDALLQLEEMSKTTEGKKIIWNRFMKEGNSMADCARKTIYNLFRNVSKHTWTGKSSHNASDQGDRIEANAYNLVVILEDVILKRFGVTRETANTAIKHEFKKFNQAVALNLKRKKEKEASANAGTRYEAENDGQMSSASDDEQV